jgi:hypothetical protein
MRLDFGVCAWTGATRSRGSLCLSPGTLVDATLQASVPARHIRDLIACGGRARCPGTVYRCEGIAREYVLDIREQQFLVLLLVVQTELNQETDIRRGPVRAGRACGCVPDRLRRSQRVLGGALLEQRHDLLVYVLAIP